LGEYGVKLLPKAYKDIDQIYGYIIKELKAPETAKKIVESFEEKILSLEEFHRRGAEKKLEYMLIKVIDSSLLKTLLLFIGSTRRVNM
jgi:plasmid stabilization system protein ParE